MALFLQGVLRGGLPLHLNGGGVDLKGLLGVGGEHKAALDHQGGAHVALANLLEVFHLAILKHNLEAAEGGAVVELNEAKGLGGADGAHPASHGDFTLLKLFGGGKELFDFCS